ncbi:MAG: response regulator [Treponema sp.]|jgi:signal transduction histidine kinase/CheY-like chemotaxis protein/HPt (histidine-containing phosphotransfer) domain-containing protein|nr:response regulator [Treponema sp.]
MKKSGSDSRKIILKKHIISPRIKKPFKKTFPVFSCVLFLIIALSAIAAYTISARQINRSFVEQQLSIASETMRLRLTATVDSELALVLKMADTPVIRQYFMNPSDPALITQANVEFAIYRKHFGNKMVFWVNDLDKIFYSTGNEPYVVNPDDPDSYWYNLTLYDTEKFNFNINYNPDLDQINLWVNVPVFADTDTFNKPIGMLGTGINLTDFSNFVASSYRKFDENIMPYMFNKYNEITSSVDYELVQNKVRLDELLGETGKELIKVAHELSEGESRTFIYDKKLFLVNSIPSMEWYFTVSYPLPGFLALNRAMNTEFFSMLLLILFLFIVINIFIARSENTMARQNLQLLEANRKAKLASQAKSDFLAKMSHEIRTPMNAITGMAELLLRGELSGEASGYAQDIKRAGNNLVSIINDILDFSKIESGKLEIVPVKYLLSSLVNDTVNIIRMRIMEKPLRFFTNIDGNIPNKLIGDEVRLRQIVLNLLSNAVKYSEKGHIGMIITTDKRDDKQVWLRITVVDTGKGIRPEDQVKLFDEFVRVDMQKNRGIEGTGLGMAITKRLCIAMGGDINVESEYGKGSVFTAVVPQNIESEEPFAVVEEPEKKKVLVYEGRAVYARSVCWTLDNLKVPYTIVTNQDEFNAALYREEWFYVFSGYGLYEKIKPVMERGVFPEGKKPPLTLMIEWGTEAYIPDTRFVSLPAQSLSIANVLNGKEDSKDYTMSSGVIRFTFPRARLLVVDDIATNLQVAEGLLAPYLAAVDTCLKGLQAIELVKRNEYDIVFMDHMMPEMDGIETTEAIRALEGARFRTVPIIALTANAVVGVREMFIENGFNDFLSKPIDISKLDDMLNRWIPKEKREKKNEQLAIINEQISNSKEQREGNVAVRRGEVANMQSQRIKTSLHASGSINIPGVDTVKGITGTGGTLAAYRKVLSMFCKDVEERIPLLQKAPDEDTLPAFITHVHSLKSASASIGAQEVSSLAAGLEAIGKAGDTAFIRESLPDFVERLAELVKNIRSGLEADTTMEYMPESPEKTQSVFSPSLRELAGALEAKKSADIERVLEELNQKPLDAKTRNALNKISDEVLMIEFGNALKIIKEINNDDFRQ